MTTEGFAPEQIDTSKAHSARVYDYWLNGKSHYEVDAEAAEEMVRIWPAVKTAARLNRDFVHRVTRWLVNEAGIRQFLDIGSGIPTEPNLHQTAQTEAPETRVVYVDNDPIVLTQAQTLLHSTPEGRTAYVHGDVKDPEAIMAAEELRATLDLGQPVALTLNALLHFLPDARRPQEIVRRLLEPLPSGSYLVITHGTTDFTSPDVNERLRACYSSAITEGQMRSRDEVLVFFDGLEMVEPGVVVTRNWRPVDEATRTRHTDMECAFYAGVARKP